MNELPAEVGKEQETVGREVVWSAACKGAEKGESLSSSRVAGLTVILNRSANENVPRPLSNMIQMGIK